MKAFVRSLSKWVGLTFVLAAAVAACSGTPTNVTPAPTCDESKCLPGNKCIKGFDNTADQVANDPKKATLKCRLVCDPTDPTKASAQDLCPSNYHCNAGGTLKSDGSAASYCVADRTPYQKPAVGKGQWGTSCNPQQGLDTNPGCDTEQNFWCYANSPDDGDAFCTQFQCTDDLDCKGGYFCATVNQNPSATTAKRSFGAAQTTTVCLPRAWNLAPNSRCGGCKTDVDCPLNQGRPQHCVGADGNGGAEKVCAVECINDKNCTLDGKCAAPSEAPTLVSTNTMGVLVATGVCLPRASTCKGDGSFCSPCSSDKDCTNGFCINADYSTERFCSFKSTTPCTMTQGSATCPMKPNGGQVSCFTKQDALKDQCIGLSNIGGSGVLGCWTPTRK